MSRTKTSPSATVTTTSPTYTNVGNYVVIPLTGRRITASPFATFMNKVSTSVFSWHKTNIFIRIKHRRRMESASLILASEWEQAEMRKVIRLCKTRLSHDIKGTLCMALCFQIRYFFLQQAVNVAPTGRSVFVTSLYIRNCLSRNCFFYHLKATTFHTTLFPL
jgi:hypothetical protein